MCLHRLTCFRLGISSDSHYYVNTFESNVLTIQLLRYLVYERRVRGDIENGPAITRQAVDVAG
jgi:hypothetical protein